MPPFLLALLVCSILCPAIADAAEPDEDVSRLREIVVSATRSPEPLTRIPATETVLTREQIERTPFREGHQTDDLLHRSLLHHRHADRPGQNPGRTVVGDGWAAVRVLT